MCPKNPDNEEGTMERHYFLSTDLDDLERVEEELEAAGISTPQIHVLSEDDADVDAHPHLHGVPSFYKKDVVHSTEVAAAFGAAGAALVLVVAWLAGWTESAAGWIPFVFLAVVVFGFVTWEGGLFGIQVPNVRYKRFENELHEHKHVLFIDVSAEQEPILARVLATHGKLRRIADEHTPAQDALVESAQRTWRRFLNWAP
jgi:hypothetical protein